MSTASDLTVAEQKSVRTALRFLRVRCGTWEVVANALRFKEGTISNVLSGRAVSASMAVRVARFLGVPVDDLLAGRYPPPGTCPACGHHSAEGNADEVQP